MYAPIQAIIDTQAAIHNCTRLHQAAGQRKVFVVIKADAYGHGMQALANALQNYVDGFCVYQLPDAITLRTNGIKLPIQVLGGFTSSEELAKLETFQLWAVAHAPYQVELLTQAQQLPERVFLKVQTGMHRLGLPPAQVPQAIANLPQANLALMHHYADADIADGTKQQEQVMAALVAQTQLPFTASNSAATLLGKDNGEEFVRCGIALYGSTPAASHTAAQLDLQPVMTLQSKVIAIQKVNQGETVGYGSRWRAEKDTKVAVVACGYADGYPRTAPDGTPVVINKKVYTLVGRVSMEMLTVAIGQDPVAIGDPVELWGKQISVDTIAAKVGTIGYELLAGMPAKVPRIYL